MKILLDMKEPSKGEFPSGANEILYIEKGGDGDHQPEVDLVHISDDCGFESRCGSCEPDEVLAWINTEDLTAAARKPLTWKPSTEEPIQGRRIAYLSKDDPGIVCFGKYWHQRIEYEPMTARTFYSCSWWMYEEEYWRTLPDWVEQAATESGVTK